MLRGPNSQRLKLFSTNGSIRASSCLLYTSYIDAIHYSVRDNGVIRKLAAYVILGINTEGKKEVLTITIGDNESAKYWLSVLNELKNRGVDRKSTRLNSSHITRSRMPSSA